MATTLGSKATGSIVKLKESGVPKEFYVAKHNYESGLNGSGRTLVVRKDCYDTRVWDSSETKDYASSSIGNWLNSTYKNLLDADIRAAVGTTKFYYTSNNGSWSVAALGRSVFLLSATELGASESLMNAEGTALPVASTIKKAYYNGSATDQWTRSPKTTTIAGIWVMRSNGTANSKSARTSTGIMSRPAFTLPASLAVSDDGTVSVNVPPTITSSMANGANLGTQSKGFAFQYVVNDANGDSVTVKEYLDNVLKRTYTASRGAANTFQAVAADNFQTVLNGPHTLKVVANDGKKDSAAYTVAFTKAVTTATITMAAPLDADDRITMMVMALAGSIPDDANLKVLVTNNAKDASPVWEDATAEVQAGANHIFTNTAAAKGYAYNFKITVGRGASGKGGYISNIGGAFE